MTRRIIMKIKNKKLIIIALLLISIFGCIIVLSLSLFRGQPANTTEKLANGVIYSRIVLSEPRPIVIHIVEAQMDLAHIKPFVTPADDLSSDKPLIARTTSEALESFDLQVAINGNTFSPWYDFSIFGYFPHSGDWVAAEGNTISNNVAYGKEKGDDNFMSLYFKGNRVITGWGNDGANNGISGIGPVVVEGELYHSTLIDNSIHPRTLVGTNQQGNKLYMIVVDGRQWGYSHGIKLTEIGNILMEVGVYNAINLDGGGSSTLVIKDADGNPLVLNSPIHQHIPGRERPVANHLGIIIK
jgi:hypothetical protein